MRTKFTRLLGVGVLAATVVALAYGASGGQAGYVPEGYDPEKELDFVWMKMDEETVQEGLREVRESTSENKKSVRGTSVTVEKPAIIPFGREQFVETGSTNDRARSFVFRNLDKNEGNWIIYPYNFTYIAPELTSSELRKESEERGSDSSYVPFRQGNQTLTDGAMISTMNTDNFPLHTYLNWIKSKTDMNLKKAKVVYDMNIAILQIQVERENEEGEKVSVDLTYDSDSFCTMFYSSMYPKYSQCFAGMSRYEEWLKKEPTKANDPTVVFVTPDDIMKGALRTKDGSENFFGMLIVPDVMMTEIASIHSLVGRATDKITQFVNAGGMVYTTGKGAFLLEHWGIVPTNTFNSRYTMTSPNRTWQFLEGCDMVGKEGPTDESENEFIQSTLCFSLPYWERKAKNSVNSLVSAPLLNTPEKGHKMTKLLWFKGINNNYRFVQHDEQTGFNSELPLTDPHAYPAVMYKTVGKGHVVVNMGNPGLSSTTYQHVYNGFILAGERPIALDNELVGGFNRTVPALEQVDLSINLKVVNYFTSKIAAGAKLYVWTIKGTTVTAPSSCKLDTSATPAAPEDLKADKKYLCTLSEMEMRSKQSFPFSVRIIDPLVTQQKKDIVVLWPQLTYTDPKNKKTETVSYGVKIQAAASALLRAEMNIDPSSQYPLHARGSYIDNVMNCENKEETQAYHVSHTSIVPIISPFIDINDQIRLSTAVILDKKYYEQSTNKVGLWKFPFPSTGGTERESDYLDWDLLYERSNMLAADWDEGVKLFRVARSDLSLPAAKGIVPGEHIMNANYQTNNDDDVFVLQQYQFDDSDKFYEHAVQRLMAFLDVTTPGGAKTYWGGSIPSGEAMVSDPTVGKRRVLFARHDVFWWKKYLMPFGLTDRNTYLSLDRYAKKGKCNDTYERSFKGAFGNNVEDGMQAAEFPNELALECRTELDVTKIEQASNGKIKYMHYIVPVDARDGKEAGDFYGFNSAGELQDYPEVRFVKTFATKVDVYPEDSRRGGEMVLKFSTAPWASAADAVSKDYVTISADQIAVFSIVAKSNTELRIRFKRGQMPNEAYGRASHLTIFLEGTTWDTSKTYDVTMELYEMHYDLAKPEQNFEDWSSKTKTQTLTFGVQGAFSLPAIRMNFAFNDDVEKSMMNPYELREPFVRYGLYEQELLGHRAVHGSAEFHPKSEPCIVTKNAGFSTFTHVGTSSVPFREYVSTGTSLQIPAASETGRVEWDDIWGRHFVQNVRSTIFEYPPIPPPLRNFVMTTTFEVLDKSGKRMLGGWRSNEDVDVHVQMKLLNNYPKWFEITDCLANRVLQSCTVEGKECGKARIYDTDNNFVAPTGTDNGKQYFKRGQNASYGICFRDTDVILQGQGPLSDGDRAKIQQMTFCAKSFGDKDRSCEKNAPGLPTLKRAPEDSAVNGSKWNFATQVYNYWPQGYIKENMWDLTHYDYDDNQFDKAYRYHMDNNLPHLGHSNTRPDNLIAFPLYKGLGYSMVYDKTYSNPRFKKYRGWWSDNLQNRDHTLVAGNAKSNDVSVGKQSLIPNDGWYDISEAQNGAKVVAEAEKNVYTCLFNRRNVKNYVSNTKVTELFNVYENNVVPVPIDFNNKMEFNYDCKRTEMYSPENISQYNNTVYTETARDWLYFAANLRGGALENINVLYKLSPLETKDIKFEGQAKVQDGGRFTYWNPANSKNSYLIVDNPVHIVMAKRNDIEIEQETIPTYTTTFDSVLYHHFTVSDPEEIEREWESSVWTNNYGYGDFTVQVYVGDAGTTALPYPGRTIRARYTFMNNAGFDINMLKDAINSTLVSQEAINSDDKMKQIVHALREPNEYNFLQVEIPAELKPYVTIKPCKDVVGIAGLFFDFDSINVVTIRDGWKGDYYYDIKIANNFPDELRGRLIEIPVKLVKKYFDNVPGVGDPTGAHDYTVEIPPLVFGVPYAASNKLWAGKVFYTSGYATKVDLRTDLQKPFTADKALVVTEEDLELYRACLGKETDPNQTTTEGEFACLDRLWAEHLKTHKTCNPKVLEDTKSKQALSFASCLEQIAPTFPIKVSAKDGPDVAQLHLLLRTHAPQLKSGWPSATKNSVCKYQDWTNKGMNSNYVWNTNVHAKGAWISLKWNMALLSSSGMPLKKDLMSPRDSGLADVTITITNTGDYYAYNVVFNLTISENITVATEDSGVAAGLPIPSGCNVTKLADGQTMFSCNVSQMLAPRSPVSYLFRVHYTPDTRNGAGAKAQAPLNMHVMATRSSASIDLTAAAGEKRVTQDLEGPYGFYYTDETDSNMLVLTGQRSSGYRVVLKASHKLQGITQYLWRARLDNSNVWTTFAVTSKTTLTEDVQKRFLALGGQKGEVAVDYVVAVTTSKKNITVNSTVPVVTQSNVYRWRVAHSNLLLLLLLLPGLAVPAAGAAAVFAVTKGADKEAVRDLGLPPKQKFVPQELVDDEPLHMTEVDESLPPPPLPQRAAPAYTAPEAPVHTAEPGKQYAIPVGPTYLRGGVPVNVVDN